MSLHILFSGGERKKVYKQQWILKGNISLIIQSSKTVEFIVVADCDLATGDILILGS